jgi:hypothetical protein
MPVSFLIHGAIDDNVHMANTIQFLYELQSREAGAVNGLIQSRATATDPVLLKHCEDDDGFYCGEL